MIEAPSPRFQYMRVVDIASITARAVLVCVASLILVAPGPSPRRTLSVPVIATVPAASRALTGASRVELRTPPKGPID